MQARKAYNDSRMLFGLGPIIFQGLSGPKWDMDTTHPGTLAAFSNSKASSASGGVSAIAGPVVASYVVSLSYPCRTTAPAPGEVGPAVAIQPLKPSQTLRR